MKRRRADQKTIRIDGNHTGDSILGDGNTLHKTNIDSEGINLGLQDVSEAIYENSRRSRWDYFRQQSALESESKDIRDTISVAFFSGVAIGISWNYLAPLNASISPLLVIAVTVLLSTLKLIHLGLRHSLTMIFLLGTVFYLFLKFTSLADIYIGVNQTAGTLILGAIGAGIGLVIGFIQMFWKPLGD